MGCDSEDNGDLQGEWNAEWSMEASDLTTDIAPENLNMSGIYNFFDDNTAEITAYGYSGCLFCSDTLTNQLTWELKDSILIMKNLDYDFTLEYAIQNQMEKSLELVLMKDITIRLSKN